MTRIVQDTNTQCPHCSVTVFFEFSFNPLTSDTEGHWFAKHAICPNCKHIICFILMYDRKNSGILHASHGVPEVQPSREHLAHPKSIQRNRPPAQVPAEFTKDYLEAALIISESPNASAALSRRLLHHILREKVGATQNTLAAAIQHVVTAQSLPSYIAESLDTLRECGNFGAHPTKSAATAEIIDVEPEEASWCLDVIDLLYDHCFVAPDKARQAKEAMNAKRKESGRNPMVQPPSSE